MACLIYENILFLRHLWKVDMIILYHWFQFMTGDYGILSLNNLVLVSMLLDSDRDLNFGLCECLTSKPQCVSALHSLCCWFLSLLRRFFILIRTN